MDILINHPQIVQPTSIDSLHEEIQSAEKFSFSLPFNYSERSYSFTFNFQKSVAFNRFVIENLECLQEIELVAHFSYDGNLWQRIPLIYLQRSPNFLEADFPLLEAKYVQIILIAQNSLSSLKVGNAFLSLFSNFTFKASSEENRLWVAENLTDGRDDYGWASDIHSTQEGDSIEIDMGKIFYLCEFRLRASKETPNYFPISFSLMASLDKNEWQTLTSESNFHASSGAWYQWKTAIWRCRYLKLVISKHSEKQKRQLISRILEASFFAKPENELNEGNNLILGKELPLASEALPGVVSFAEANATSPNKAVQGNDPRLREASCEYPGIVRLAKNLESRKNFVVQSNDNRLKNSSTERAGLVQLAKNKEKTEGKAVQANDSRLQKATFDDFGLIQLAKDKEVSCDKVLLSNDSRLKEGSENSPGIVTFAKDLENAPLKALQSNDKRLRVASTEWKGILQFANHLESKELKALQSDDPRLKEGTESIKGRVCFAKDKEVAAFKALQSNDSRLQKADVNLHGFACFAAHEEKNSLKAVQSDDPRLENKREPLPHSHEYAALNHDFNSHKGKLYLDINEEQTFPQGIDALSAARYPLAVKNSSGHAALFQGGMVSRGENFSAILALGNRHAAVEARTRTAPAGVFFSERDIALYLPKTLGNFRSGGKSLKAEAICEFQSEVQATASQGLAIWWKKNPQENFSEGDILALDEQGSVKKISDSSETVIGVYTSQTGIILKPKTVQTDGVAVLVAGRAKVKVKGKVKIGDKVGFLYGDAGIARKLEKNSLSSLVGIALESTTTTETFNSENKKEKIIECLLRLN